MLVFVDRAAIRAAGVCCELTNLPNWHLMWLDIGSTLLRNISFCLGSQMFNQKIY